jgi:hypothetical protein
MVRPLGRPLERKAVTLEDLREDFLAHCEARNLSERTLEWYGDRTRRFADWSDNGRVDPPERNGRPSRGSREPTELDLMQSTARIVIGVLYALGTIHQAMFTLRNSRAFYEAMAERAWIPPAQVFVEKALVPNSLVITVMVVLFQGALAVAILGRGAWTAPALVAGGVFSVVGALTGSPAETVGYTILAGVHFALAASP